MRVTASGLECGEHRETGHRLPHQGTEQLQQPPQHRDPPRPHEQGQLEHGVLGLFGQTLKCLAHWPHVSLFILFMIVSGKELATKEQSRINLYYSITSCLFPFCFYFEKSPYQVQVIHLHTLIADLRDVLLLPQAAADELQRGEHLQMENLVTGYSCFQLSSRTVVHT